MKKQKDRLVELLEESSKRVGEYIDSRHIIPSAEEVHSLRADHLLENGVIVPPCKIGQTVYRIYTNSWIGEDKVCRFSATESGLRYHDDKGRETSCDKFGKLVFLSEAEAKYALKNRRSVSLVNGHIEE